jgi:hypothetical protein
MKSSKLKNRKFVSGIFLSLCGLGVLIKEYLEKEADHAIVIQAMGLIILGIGLIIGKSL